MFYTYLHCKPDGTPFYVGKGRGRRAHLIAGIYRNSYHNNVVKKYGSAHIQVFVFPCDSEEQALSDEVQQIAQMKREGYALTNLTGGGNGMREPSDETRKKMSDAGKRKGFPLEARIRHAEALTGVPRTEEVKAKVSASLQGHPVSAETRKKLSERRIGIQLTPEHRAAIKKALAIPEVKARMSLSGGKHRIGTRHTEETKAKMRAAQAARFAKEIK